VPDGTSIKFVEELEKDLAELSGCDAKIASGGGRMHVTMDRYEVGCCFQLLEGLPPAAARMAALSTFLNDWSRAVGLPYVASA